MQILRVSAWALFGFASLAACQVQMGNPPPQTPPPAGSSTAAPSATPAPTPTEAPPPAPLPSPPHS